MLNFFHDAFYLPFTSYLSAKLLAKEKMSELLLITIKIFHHACFSYFILMIKCSI